MYFWTKDVPPRFALAGICALRVLMILLFTLQQNVQPAGAKARVIVFQQGQRALV